MCNGIKLLKKRVVIRDLVVYRHFWITNDLVIIIVFEHNNYNMIKIWD